jgi:recombining binding protein suppressor of hairless
MRQPLDVFLGKVGPLRHRVYQASPSGPLTSVGGFVTVGGEEGPEAVSNAPTFIPTNQVHTIVIVEMPPIVDVIKALEEDAIPPPMEESGSSSANGDRPPPPPMPSIQGRSLPLLFIRGSDGVGYHSGRTVTCENVFAAMNLGPGADIDGNWISTAQASAVADLHYTLRIM